MRTSSRPSPVTEEVRNTGARESVWMWRAHVYTSSSVRTYIQGCPSLLCLMTIAAPHREGDRRDERVLG